ncbi:MAG: efflux RND transporter periplasmic adaptor subunit [Candidatus Omnitrophica bacterium]|nr:efflux RND transporter periplasmic adaptor subunit [Candidatus Omnitrophota bacterium]
MRNKIIGLLLFLVVAGGAGYYFGPREKKASGEMFNEIRPFTGTIVTYISCTGTVFPKNRLEVKPPVNGRIEKIMVKEGDEVKIGQVLAWMSSTDRAALIDAARGKGEEALKHWEEAYKPIPLPAPIDGEVIVGTIQPGQTVTTTEAVVVLSDRLIVRAQVDETDIGKIKLDMKAVITLDAYTDTKIKAVVEHIYYESETVNNVTIYKVDLVPAEVPAFFRSGMNATVDFIEQDKENILVIPAEAVYKDNGDRYVLVSRGTGQELLKTPVTLGITDDKNIEVISGVTAGDKIMLKSKKYSLPRNNIGKNPFMPGR